MESQPQRAGGEAVRDERRTRRIQVVCAQQVASNQRDETAGVSVEFIERERAFAFRRAQLHAGDQAEQVAVAVGCRDENGEGRGARVG